MTQSAALSHNAETIRVRGLVQGVGFRPTVWRLAREFGLSGLVLNDGDGVQILAQGSMAALDGFAEALTDQCPPLGRIDAIEREPVGVDHGLDDFLIIASSHTHAHTGVVPDAATCPQCVGEIFATENRRHGYAFTNCTHCGPRLSIIQKIPYDRAHTTMAAFDQCPECLQEYGDPTDRRFHAQPNACPVCGPRVWLESVAGEMLAEVDAIEQAAKFIKAGQILAIKGIGGIHLACDASNEAAVSRLRERKHRYRKPLAMMARTIESISRYATVGELEMEALLGTDAPIVVLNTDEQKQTLAPSVAPGQNSLGFMLPYSPLHHLLMAHVDGPMVLTSGNRSDEPQCIMNEDARSRLSGIADALLLHDRDIANRIDDSVVRLMDGKISVLRRARGLAPAPLQLPQGFEKTPDLLAMGAELKNTFCVLQDGQAIVSQHMGDLEDARTFDSYLHNLSLYQQLFQHHPQAIVVDRHPEYLSTKHGESLAQAHGLPLIEVQHHHAHIASCLADNAHALHAGKVLGIAMDGLGYGDHGELWGGEFLLADYASYERVGHLRPFAMPGQAQAMREPWRNTYAHLTTCYDWERLLTEFDQVAIFQALRQKPLATFDAMMTRAVNAPLASSAGRLFDAVAAAIGICTEQVQYEGQAAIEMEARLSGELPERGYDFSLKDHVIDPCPMWWSLLCDVRDEVDTADIAGRFHRGLADALANNAISLCREHLVDTVALSGGVFQNKTLLTACRQALETAGLTVLTHQQVPANDGGLAFGQAVIAAAILSRSN